MGHRDDGHRLLALLQRVDVVDEPSNVELVKVPRRLVHHEDVSVHHLGTHQAHLHLPPSRKLAQCHVELVSALEANRGQLLLHLLHAGLTLVEHGLNDGLVQEVVKGRPIAFGLCLADAMLDKRSLQLRFWGEAVHLLIVDRPHKGRLAAVVGAQKAIVPAALEVEPRVVQKRERTVPEREHAVAQVLALLFLHFVGLDAVGRLEAQVASALCDLGGELEGAIDFCPNRLVKVPVRGQTAAHAGQVISNVANVIVPAVLSDWILDGSLHRLWVSTAGLSCLLRSHQCVVRSLSDSACLGIGDLVTCLLECREEQR
mmetsp:Transcript_128228/g.399263  ORF Transcript_128228/g.399263 Transcript_128228/m.399263 type:complete len:315 (+) Transcript_128228:1711-2655(+)